MASIPVSLLPGEHKQLNSFLAANEFRQLNLADFGVTNGYNVRVTVRVISGTGRVTAYGSMIDQVTQDPTYDPPL